MTNGKGFLFEEKPLTNSTTPYSWTFIDDDTASQSHRVTAGWYGTKAEAVAGARAWQRDICNIDVPDDPEFKNTDSPIA